MAGKVKYFYSRERRKEYEEGYIFFNPRFFAGVPDDAGSAVLNGSAEANEDIVAAYAEAGITLKVLDAGNPKAKPVDAPPPKSPEAQN